MPTILPTRMPTSTRIGAYSTATLPSSLVIRTNPAPSTARTNIVVPVSDSPPGSQADAASPARPPSLPGIVPLADQDGDTLDSTQAVLAGTPGGADYAANTSNEVTTGSSPQLEDQPATSGKETGNKALVNSLLWAATILLLAALAAMLILPMLTKKRNDIMKRILKGALIMPPTNKPFIFIAFITIILVLSLTSMVQAQDGTAELGVFESFLVAPGGCGPGAGIRTQCNRPVRAGYHHGI